MNALRLALFGVATGSVALALLFSIICVATDSWIAFEFEIGDVNGNLGLWKGCVTIGGDSTCVKICKLFIAAVIFVYLLQIHEYI